MNINELHERLTALENLIGNARITAGSGLSAEGSFHHGFALNIAESGGGSGADMIVGHPWIWHSIGKLWPDEINPPTVGPSYTWHSDNIGWYWHRNCARTFRYNRDVVTGALSNRQVFHICGDISYATRDIHRGGLNTFQDYLPFDPEVFDNSVAPPILLANWFNPSSTDVTHWLTYIGSTSPAGIPTATQEVVFSVTFFREKQWANPNYPIDGFWQGWTYRLDESTGSWPCITEIAFRYIE